MWIQLNNGFYSIVVDRTTVNKSGLLVRARRPGDLERLLGTRNLVVHRTEGNDYLFRCTVTRGRLIRALSRQVLRIGYDNFKNSVKDTALHNAYSRIWAVLSSLQPVPPYHHRFVNTDALDYIQSIKESDLPAIEILEEDWPYKEDPSELPPPRLGRRLIRRMARGRFTKVPCPECDMAPGYHKRNCSLGPVPESWWTRNDRR